MRAHRRGNRLRRVGRNPVHGQDHVALGNACLRGARAGHHALHHLTHAGRRARRFVRLRPSQTNAQVRAAGRVRAPRHVWPQPAEPERERCHAAAHRDHRITERRFRGRIERHRRDIVDPRLQERQVQVAVHGETLARYGEPVAKQHVDAPRAGAQLAGLGQHVPVVVHHHAVGGVARIHDDRHDRVRVRVGERGQHLEHCRATFLLLLAQVGAIADAAVAGTVTLGILVRAARLGRHLHGILRGIRQVLAGGHRLAHALHALLRALHGGRGVQVGPLARGGIHAHQRAVQRKHRAARIPWAQRCFDRQHPALAPDHAAHAQRRRSPRIPLRPKRMPERHHRVAGGQLRGRTQFHERHFLAARLDLHQTHVAVRPEVLPGGGALHLRAIGQQHLHALARLLAHVPGGQHPAVLRDDRPAAGALLDALLVDTHEPHHRGPHLRGHGADAHLQRLQGLR